MKMKAFRLTGWQKEPELQEVPVPEPGPGEVLVKVAAAGACHSDIHLIEWRPGRLKWELPFTLGHETAGWVAALGPGAGGFEVGDPVAVYGAWGCGVCPPCRQGFENYCERPAERGAGGGLGFDGGMAEYLLVPSPRLLVPLGDLDPVAAAPLGDAGLTSYHAVKRALPSLEPGTAAVVIGVGGLGHLAIQILKAVSPARVVAVDTDPAKLRLAIQVGADRAVHAAEEAAGQVREATGGKGAQVVLDFVGESSTLALGAQVVRPRGQLTLVGLGDGSIRFDFHALPYEASLATTYWGSVGELHEVLNLARAGKIRPHVERFALGDAQEAYALLRAGKLKARAVVVPGQTAVQLGGSTLHELNVLGGGYEFDLPRD